MWWKIIIVKLNEIYLKTLSREMNKKTEFTYRLYFVYLKFKCYGPLLILNITLRRFSTLTKHPELERENLMHLTQHWWYTFKESFNFYLYRAMVSTPCCTVTTLKGTPGMISLDRSKDQRRQWDERTKRSRVDNKLILNRRQAHQVIFTSFNHLRLGACLER